MGRDLTVAMQSAVAQGTVRPVLFYEGEFSAGTVRLWTGVGTVTWNGESWLGAGELLDVSPIEVSGDVRASGMSVSLSGMPGSLISVVLAQAQQGLAGRVYVGLMDSAGAVIADPHLAFSGRLDVPIIDDAGDRCTITISYEGRLIDLQRARERRYTDEDQRIEFPHDRGFEFIPSLQDAAIVWEG